MTCQKVYISQNNQKTATTTVKNNAISVNSRISEQPKEPHKPEIVLGKVTYFPEQNKKQKIFRLPLGKIIAVSALCLVSFVIGCSFTNERLAEFIGDIAAISSGNTTKKDESKMVGKSGNVTFYEKYMSDETESIPTEKLEYLSAEAETKEAVTTDLPQWSEVSVSTPGEGKIGADGEVIYRVYSEDLSDTNIHSLNNQTGYAPDTYALISKTPKALENLTINPTEPLVLVVHTHGTECYNSYENPDYTGESTPVRSDNIEENVVGVGNKLVSVLTDLGIPAIHSQKMCDKDSFVTAYRTSFDEVSSYLEKYPSIRFVIDLHRDAIGHSDGSQTKPVFNSFGNNTAQLMLVVGTDSSGVNHPNWQDNLAFALTLQSKISKDNPQLFRRINLRTASFNQQLSPGYLLLECGAVSNTLEEAENAAELFATGFARVINEYAN